MGHRIGIIEVALTVIDDFHVSRNALKAVNRHTVHLNPHDGQVGRVQRHISVVGREIVLVGLPVT